MSSINQQETPFSQINKESPFKSLQDNPDRYLWLLALAPLMASIVIYLFAIPPLYASIVLVVPNLVFAFMDEKLLKSTNRTVPAHWTVFVVPVYIWQRIKVTGLDKRAMLVWCAAFACSVFTVQIAQQKYIEDAACKIVSDIVKKQLYSEAECVGVSIKKETKSGFYKADATLDNGNDVDITIDTRKSGQILVQIPNLLFSIQY